jgi:hypothetical protein
MFIKTLFFFTLKFLHTMRSLTQIKTQLNASNIDAINNTQLGLVKGGTGYGYGCGCGNTKSIKVKSIKVKSLKVRCGSKKKSTKKSSGSPYCTPRPNPCFGW